MNRSVALLGIACAGLLASCGGNQSDNSALSTSSGAPASTASVHVQATRPSEDAQIRQLAASFEKDYNAKNWQAVCKQLSPAAATQIETGVSQYTGKSASCTAALKAVGALDKTSLRSHITTLTIDGDKAVAPSASTDADGTQNDEHFERIAGRWYVGPDPDTGTPSTAVVKAWAGEWCDQVKVGMTQPQIEAIMGPPTGAFKRGENGSTQQQASWDAAEWQFNAFFNLDGKAQQLDINDIELSAAEKKRLTCATTRR